MLRLCRAYAAPADHTRHTGRGVTVDTGLDTVHSIIAGWAAEFPDNPTFTVPASLAAKVAGGKLGRKSGQGFYKWDGDKLAE